MKKEWKLCTVSIRSFSSRKLENVLLQAGLLARSLLTPSHPGLVG